MFLSGSVNSTTPARAAEKAAVDDSSFSYRALIPDRLSCVGPSISEGHESSLPMPCGTSMVPAVARPECLRVSPPGERARRGPLWLTPFHTEFLLGADVRMMPVTS